MVALAAAQAPSPLVEPGAILTADGTVPDRQTQRSTHGLTVTRAHLRAAAFHLPLSRQHQLVAFRAATIRLSPEEQLHVVTLRTVDARRYREDPVRARRSPPKEFP